MAGTSNTLTRELVFEQLDAEDGFPIDFDDAIAWIGYSNRGNAKRTLIANFEQDYHFIISDKMVKRLQGGGRSLERISLTVDCFKEFAMMARTKQGKEVRAFYIQIEKEWRQMRQFQKPLPPARDRSTSVALFRATPAPEPQPEPPSPATEEESELAESSSLALLEDIRSEFQIDKDGKAFASRRVIARLAGVEDSSIVRLLAKIAEGAALKGVKSLEILAGQSFEGAALIPDTAAACIIAYYAMDAGRYCTQQAKQAFLAFSAIGFRTWVQHELGWQPKPQLQNVDNQATLGNAFRGLAAVADEVAIIQAKQAETDARLTQTEQALADLLAKQQSAQSASRRDPKLAHLPLSNQGLPEQSLRSKIVECDRSLCKFCKIKSPGEMMLGLAAVENFKNFLPEWI